MERKERPTQMKEDSAGTLKCVFLCNHLALRVDIHFFIIHIKTWAPAQVSAAVQCHEDKLGYISLLMVVKGLSNEQMENVI